MIWAKHTSRMNHASHVKFLSGSRDWDWDWDWDWGSLLPVAAVQVSPEASQLLLRGNIAVHDVNLNLHLHLHLILNLHIPGPVREH